MRLSCQCFPQIASKYFVEFWGENCYNFQFNFLLCKIFEICIFIVLDEMSIYTEHITTTTLFVGIVFLS